MEKNKVHILLIDNDEKDFIRTGSLLEKIPQNITLSWTHDYSQAIEMLCSSEYDICLLEYNLGRRTGIELLKKARSQECHTPIIMLTTKGDLKADILAMQYGAVDYLVKGHVTPSLLERKRTPETPQRADETN
jgi:DNA-binding response OmpR family regulator